MRGISPRWVVDTSAPLLFMNVVGIIFLFQKPAFMANCARLFSPTTLTSVCSSGWITSNLNFSGENFITEIVWAAPKRVVDRV